MTNWDDLRVFLAVATHGSHARAARSLGVDPTTMGRRIVALEESLETRLLVRTPSGLVPTPAGRALLVRAARVEQEMLASERELRGRDARLEGSVVVTAGDGISALLLAPWLLELRQEHPGLSLDLRSDNATLDMSRREADIAIRLSRPRESSLIAAKVGRLTFGVYGSERYFARRGRPRTTADLSTHDWIAWDARLVGAPQSRWLLRHVPSSRVMFRANTTAVLTAACAIGHGLAVLPKLVGAQDHRLLPILPRSQPPTRDVWVVTHSDSRNNARVRATVAWLSSRFRDATDGSTV